MEVTVQGLLCISTKDVLVIHSERGFDRVNSDSSLQKARLRTRAIVRRHNEQLGTLY